MKKLLFALALVLSLTGCLPVSQNPLSSLENATADSRLFGVWYGKSGEDEIFLHFVPPASAEMQVVEVDHEKKGAAHTTLYSVFPSVLGEHHYLNIREGKGKPYYLAHYEIIDGKLKIVLMSEKTLAKAIKAGKIKGNVAEKAGSDGGMDRSITLTDSTEHLAAFVKKSDQEVLFDQKFGTFKKISLPSFGEESKPTPSAKKKKKK